MKLGKFLVGIMGIVLVGIAIFAVQLGIDNDSGWGIGRKLLIGVGGILIFANLLGVVFPYKPVKIAGFYPEQFNKFKTISYSTRLNIFSFLAIVVVGAVYIWSFLPFIPPKPTTNNYSQLAIAFKKNQLYLPEQPPASLLSLEDPYDYESRKQVEADFTWDHSLYNGRFYLYWGPVPSLLLTIFSNEQLATLGDQYVFFAFLCGLFFYSVLLIRNFWGKFNNKLPAWTIGVSLLAVGLCGPLIRMLNSPRIYEAAIVACQFFFIGGCYWAYSAIRTTPPGLWKLAFAGLHWALAIGTRITILPVIFFLSAIMVVSILWENKPIELGKLAHVLIIIGIPLLIVMTGLGWYNLARFDSVFEFGLRYQLANVNYNKFTNIFSMDYLSGNFYTYFFQPFKTQVKFPFLRAIEKITSSERITGLVYTTPFLLVAFIPLIHLFTPRLILQRIREVVQNGMGAEGWIILGLTGSSLISLGIILLYYFPAVRFAMDFLPAGMLLATVSLGQGYEFFKGNTVFGKSFLFLVTVLVVSSVTVSLLIAIPIYRTGYVLLIIKLVQQYFGLR